MSQSTQCPGSVVPLAMFFILVTCSFGISGVIGNDFWEFGNGNG